MITQRSYRKGNVWLYPFVFFLYGLTALYGTFMPLHLRDIPVETRGMLLSLGSIVSSVAPLIWGRAADRRYSTKYLLIVSCLACSIIYPIILSTFDLWWLAFLMPVMTFFSSSYGSLTDNLTVSVTRASGSQFGILRLMGTLGFGIFALVAGLITKGSNSIGLRFLYPLVAFFAIFSLLQSGSSSKVNPQHDATTAPSDKKKHSGGLIRAIVSTLPTFPILLVIVVLTHIPLSYFYNFFSVFFV